MMNAIAGLYEGKVTVEHVDEVPGNIFTTLLQRVIEGDLGSSGYDAYTGHVLAGTAGSANSLWEDHVFQGIKETLKL